MMTAVGKIQEAKLLQDKHTLQLTVKINSLLVKIEYGTASFFLSRFQSHTYTDREHLHTSSDFNSQSMTVTLCSWSSYKSTILYRCGGSRVNAYAMPSSAEICVYSKLLKVPISSVFCLCFFAVLWKGPYVFLGNQPPLITALECSDSVLVLCRYRNVTPRN